MRYRSYRLIFGILLFPTLAMAAASTSAPVPDQDDTTPLGMLREADRDMADRGISYARSLYDAKTDKEKEFADASAQCDVASALLERVLIKKFGKADSEKVLHAMGCEATSDIESATIKIDGAHATIVWKDGSPSSPLVRVDGHWRIPAAESMKLLVDQGYKDPAGFYADVRKVVDGLTADITVEKYKTVDEITTAAEIAVYKITPDSVKNATTAPTTAVPNI